jgi:hypothetical protein
MLRKVLMVGITTRLVAKVLGHYRELRRRRKPQSPPLRLAQEPDTFPGAIDATSWVAGTVPVSATSLAERAARIRKACGQNGGWNG